MKEFNESARAFQEAYEAWTELIDIGLQQPELADVVSIGQEHARKSLHELEAEVSREFEAAVIPVVDPATEQLRREIEGLRQTKAYPKYVTEEVIQARLNALPRPEQYSGNDIHFATAYWVGRLLLHAFNFTPCLVAETPAQEPEKALTGLDATPQGAESTADDSVSLPEEEHRLSVKLPNEKVISGKLAHLLLLLQTSSRENPLTDEQFRSAQIYSEQELAKLKHKDFPLSSLVGSLRYRFRQLGVANVLKIHSAKTDSGKMVYYLENTENTIPEEESSVADQAETQEVIPETDSELSIHDAATLAECINLRAPLLRQLGLPTLDAYILARFDENLPDIIKPMSQAELDLQRARTYDFISRSLTPGKINSLLDDLGPEDPRSDLLIYIHDLVQAKESRILFERALRAHIISIYRENSSRRGVHSELDVIKYEFDDGTRPIEVPYSYIVDGMIAPQPEIKPKPSMEEDGLEPITFAEFPTGLLKRKGSTASTAASTARSAETVQQADQLNTQKPEPRPEGIAAPVTAENGPEWEKDFKKKIGYAIDQLANDGLMEEGFVTAATVGRKSSSALIGTRTNLLRLQQAGIIKYSGDYRAVELQAADIVCMAIFNTSSRELGKGSRQKRAMEIVRSSIESFFEHRRQSGQTS